MNDAKEPSIKEAIKMKYDLEREIENLINKFQSVTGLTIENLDLSPHPVIDTYGEVEPDFRFVTVSIEIKL